MLVFEIVFVLFLKLSFFSVAEQNGCDNNVAAKIQDERIIIPFFHRHLTPLNNLNFFKGLTRTFKTIITYF